MVPGPISSPKNPAESGVFGAGLQLCEVPHKHQTSIRLANVVGFMCNASLFLSRVGESG
jgi:hypothetical protein